MDAGQAVEEFQSTLSMRRATTSLLKNLRLSGFQSTLSMRRATGGFLGLLLVADISIHALHEESDNGGNHLHKAATDFNPRSP